MMPDIFTEGKAAINLKKEKIASRKMPVFYNPDMKLNRDITVGILNQSDKEIVAALPLAGSGVRAIRIAKECKDVKCICANDISKTAYDKIKENLELNELPYVERDAKEKGSSGVFITNLEANDFFIRSGGFNYIDIDPFGDPNPFLDQAMRRISRDGILAVTATDTGPLCGAYPKPCRRKYDAKPLHNELSNEAGVRILIRKVQIIASQFEKAAIPIYSYNYQHYMRVFFKIQYSKTRCDEVLKQHQYILYCPHCLNHFFSKYNNHECCGKQMEYGGLLYAGDLWDTKVAEGLGSEDFYKTIAAESRINGCCFFDIHAYCKKHKINIMKKKNEVIDIIRKKGFKASSTHFSPYGVRSDIGHEGFLEVLKG